MAHRAGHRLFTKSAYTAFFKTSGHHSCLVWLTQRDALPCLVSPCFGLCGHNDFSLQCTICHWRKYFLECICENDGYVWSLLSRVSKIGSYGKYHMGNILGSNDLYRYWQQNHVHWQIHVKHGQLPFSGPDARKASSLRLRSYFISFQALSLRRVYIRWRITF